MKCPACKHDIMQQHTLVEKDAEGWAGMVVCREPECLCRGTWGIEPAPFEVPRHRLQVEALTDHEVRQTLPVEDQGPMTINAVQFAVFENDLFIVYGDQDWVADGQALQTHSSTAIAVRRQVTVQYGEWERHHVKRP